MLPSRWIKLPEVYNDLPLHIPGGDDIRTLGEAEKTFIAWRKCYIVIPGMPKPELPPALPQQRSGPQTITTLLRAVVTMG
jgi:hypothetical protein